jgi:hypothetical protein
MVTYYLSEMSYFHIYHLGLKSRYQNKRYQVLKIKNLKIRNLDKKNCYNRNLITIIGECQFLEAISQLKISYRKYFQLKTLKENLMI